MSKITPTLWFDHQAEDAAKFYTSLFKDSKLGRIARYGKSGAEVSGQKEGSVVTVDFQIAGLTFVALNGGPLFKFSQSNSFFIYCQSSDEVDHFWEALSRKGQVMMELNQYPWAEKYGWVQDQFGVSWQVFLSRENQVQKIVPCLLFTNQKVGKGEEAIELYLSAFKNSELIAKEIEPKSKTIMFSSFMIDGYQFSLMESSIPHNFDFTHAVSYIINCKAQDEVDHYWSRLGEGGTYERCGWVQDKFGVSWQVVPHIMGELMSDSDPDRVEKVMKAMFKMKKLDIEKLKAAYKGE